MNLQETIKTWRWRIVRAGYTNKGFSEKLGISQSNLSEYSSGKKKPSICRFDLIEGKLREHENVSHNDE